MGFMLTLNSSMLHLFTFPEVALKELQEVLDHSLQQDSQIQVCVEKIGQWCHACQQAAQAKDWQERQGMLA
jgi:hypothetical protein